MSDGREPVSSTSIGLGAQSDTSLPSIETEVIESLNIYGGQTVKASTYERSGALPILRSITITEYDENETVRTVFELDTQRLGQEYSRLPTVLIDGRIIPEAQTDSRTQSIKTEITESRNIHGGRTVKASRYQKSGALQILISSTIIECNEKGKAMSRKVYDSLGRQISG
ncbi:hypothetical protein MPTK1_5g05410 [Marchantia polymorpha subsp. ruderalis]|uniref:Uncharacterized protein n=2 Tax=Marchantia polymorpha TaxID=3197 RepID=A0AAF6BF80_MARPO|nr:hypothetical protein MARPO_0027s0082 [Marchantia polymorpha]BBN10662.1 hypothetical protein Mp_5g05410 [Marchantia polymorpha subsp. ruderalis]PTQ42970.1 hypothetical protein MARPO_0027s0085 [Marchantia polymorpha]PTQ42971.1 hypothetical protein MARPO_0027s0085 [Marchantia polymorpha]PTQ42972.1 hypothetical protein MARPO_0027s0085 [Marchantia polymorpha]|eukprot:PTQ42967.1 hypothetical protein MARPO_0027s0082 [Marchantia polymorpha]